MSVVEVPSHRSWLFGCVISGVGFTVIANILAGPGQPFTIGLTIILAITGTPVLLIALNDAILPQPLAAKPIEVLLLVQL